MNVRIRLAIAAIASIAALAAMVGAAAARRFEVSEQQFRATFEQFGYNGGGVNVLCRVTLSGSFHSRTISKVCGQLIGYITQASLARPCIQGEAWVLNGVERLSDGTTSSNTLPWHVRYMSFTGTLPSITRIQVAVVGYAFLEICIGSSCLFKSTAERPALFDFTLSSGRVTGFKWDETAQVPLFIRGGITCPTEVVFEGTGAVTATATSREVFVRLVQ
jgi:hypothetical protein